MKWINYVPYLTLQNFTHEVHQFCHLKLQSSNWHPCFVFWRSCTIDLYPETRCHALTQILHESAWIVIKTEFLHIQSGPIWVPDLIFLYKEESCLFTFSYVLFVIDNNTNKVLPRATWAWLVHFVTCLSMVGLKIWSWVINCFLCFVVSWFVDLRGAFSH